MLATKTSWLNRFLGTSHRSSVEEAPPIDEPSKDTYMKMFADSFERAEKPEVEEKDADDIIKTAIEATFLVPTKPSAASNAAIDAVDEPPSPEQRTIQLHNLPYNIREDEVILQQQQLLC
jgi:hypothetical protein